MIDELELEQLRKHPEWQAVLRVYHDQHQLSREKSPDFDGWIPRLTEVESVDPTTLPSIHGKLIAFGLLKFDVGGRDVGIRYQLSPQARHALLGKPAEESDEDAGEQPLLRTA